MNYPEYLKEIEERETQGLSPKPIDGADLIAEIIAQIKDTSNEHRKASLDFFIFNTLPGTTPAAGEKAGFLKEIILGQAIVEEITPTFAFELLSHMKGGPSVEVLLDLALGEDPRIAQQAAEVLKTQVFSTKPTRIVSTKRSKRVTLLPKRFWRVTPRLNSSPNSRMSMRRLMSSPTLPLKGIFRLTYFHQAIRPTLVPTVNCMENA